MRKYVSKVLYFKMPFSIKLDAFRRALAVITNHSKDPDPNS